MVFRSLVFLVLFALLQLSWQTLRGTAAERFIVHDCTVEPAAWLVSRLTPSVHVRAVDYSLRSRGGNLNVRNGCDGMEALFLLSAALLVASIRWRHRMVGLLLGVGVVFLVNQVRILMLFYANRAGPDWFEPLHGAITPIGVILAVSVYFYAWLVYSGSQGACTS
jgi:exosortase family protein XrtM